MADRLKQQRDYAAFYELLDEFRRNDSCFAPGKLIPHNPYETNKPLLSDQTKDNLKTLIHTYSKIIRAIQPEAEAKLYYLRGKAWLDLGSWETGEEDLSRAFSLGLDGLSEEMVRDFGVLFGVAQVRAGKLLQGLARLETAHDSTFNGKLKKELQIFIGEIKFILWHNDNVQKRSERIASLRAKVTLEETAGENDKQLFNELFAAEAVEEKMQMAPQFLRCPLKRSVFNRPYVTSIGHTYEKCAIFEHYNNCTHRSDLRDPVTGHHIWYIKPDFAMTKAAEWYKRQYGMIYGDVEADKYPFWNGFVKK